MEKKKRGRRQEEKGKDEKEMKGGWERKRQAKEKNWEVRN